MTFKRIATFAAACALTCALICTMSGCGFRGGITAGPTLAADPGSREITVAESPTVAPPIPAGNDAVPGRILYQLAAPADCKSGGPHCSKPAASYAGSLGGSVDAEGNIRLSDPAGLP